MQTRPTRTEGPAQNGEGWGLAERMPTSVHSHETRWKVPPSRSTRRSSGTKQPGTRSRWWSIHRAGVNRMRVPGGMAEEANAHGKAVGYADVGPVSWKVERLVGVETS